MWDQDVFDPINNRAVNYIHFEFPDGSRGEFVSIGDATVVVMYMFPEFMNLWQPIALKHLKPGSRIVSHDYSWQNDKPGVVPWEPDQTVKVRSATREHTVHMWTVKERKKD